MKRKLTAVFLLTALLLCACKEKAKVPTAEETFPETTGSEAVPETTEPAPVYDNNLIEDHVFTGEMEDGYNDYRQTYELHIPEILDDTEDARNFNIQHQSLMEAVQAGEYLPYREITWKSYWNGSLLSLVKEMTDSDLDLTGYSVINYDFRLGRALTNLEVLERVGISHQQYLEALRRQAAGASDKNMLMMTEYMTPDAPDYLTGLLDLRGETIGDSNLSEERALLYLDDRGEIHTIIDLHVPAGGGRTPVFLTPDLNMEGREKTAECEFVSAELKNNQVTVTFHDTGRAKLFTEQRNLKLDTPYSVQGLYGNYQEISLGFMGNGGEIYLFLTDDMGLVTFCNLFRCLEYSENLYGIGPLPFPQKVTGFLPAEDPSGHTVAALTEEGTKSLDSFVWEAERSVPWALNGMRWKNEGETLGFTTEKNTDILSWQVKDQTVGEGTITYLGMTGKGLHYGFRIYTPDGTSCGVLTLHYYSDFDTPYGLYVMQYSGVPLLEKGKEENFHMLWN